jgi:hypothetical protein
MKQGLIMISTKTVSSYILQAWYAALAIWLAILLSACKAIPVSPDQAGTTAPPSNKTLVEYRRIGGIAGLDDHLIITDNGTITLTRRDKSLNGQLDAAQLQKLQQTLVAAKIDQLDAEYLPAKPGADYMEYVIVYTDHQVRTVDTAVPDALQPLLALLNGIIKTINQSTS